MATEDESNEWDGCSRECRKAGAHTLKWGRCEFGVEPEARVDIVRVVMMDDGHPSIVTESATVSDMAERIEKVLRTIPIRLGPNALAILGRGGQVTLSGGEYSEMALAVAMDLTRPDGDATR